MGLPAPHELPAFPLHLPTWMEMKVRLLSGQWLAHGDPSATTSGPSHLQHRCSWTPLWAVPYGFGGGEGFDAAIWKFQATRNKLVACLLHFHYVKGNTGFIFFDPQ